MEVDHNHNLGAMVEVKSKCGEVFVSKTGDMSCFCLMCHCIFVNFSEFSNHIFEDHFNKHFNNLNKIESDEVNNFGVNKSFAEYTKFSVDANSEIDYLSTSPIIDCEIKKENNLVKLGNNFDYLSNEKNSEEENLTDGAEILKPKTDLFEIEQPISKNKITQFIDFKILSYKNSDPKFQKEGSLIMHNIKEKRNPLNTFPCRKVSEKISSLQINSTEYCSNDKNEHNIKVGPNEPSDLNAIKCFNKTENRLNMLDRNFKIDKKMPIKCKFCSKEFLKTKSLEKHEERHKRIETCEYCGKLFESQKAKYQQHLRSHTGEKPFICPICSSAFSTRGNLNHHKSTCHSDERPYICTWQNCGKGFKKDRQRVWHERIHSGEKPYQCEQCGQHFAFQHKLSLHKKQKHIDKKDRPHKCDQCEKAFVLPRQLREHKYTHTGEKPHHCDICPARFAKRGGLTEHKKLHTGLKKHVCEVCGRAFAQRAGYTTHIKSHCYV